MDLGPIQRRAASQAALITHAQLLELGWSVKQIRGLRAAGVLIDLHRGVYRLVGTVDTWRLRCRGAVLRAGDHALLGGRAALG